MKRPFDEKLFSVKDLVGERGKVGSRLIFRTSIKKKYYSLNPEDRFSPGSDPKLS